MTTDKIKALIAQTIQGQGDAVDVGGGLAKILTSFAESAPKVVYLDDIQFDSGKAIITREQHLNMLSAEVLAYKGAKYWAIGIIPTGLMDSINQEFKISLDRLWGYIIYASNDFSIDTAEAFALGNSGNNPCLIKIQI